MTKIWTAKYEEVFLRAIVSDEEILKALLEQILETKIDEIILVSEKPNNDHVYTKEGSVDILIKTDKDYIIIELNTNCNKETINSNISYVCNVMRNIVKKGERYKIQPKMTRINLNFENDGKDPICKYQLYDKKHKIVNDVLTIYEVDVNFYKKIEYKKDVENIKRKELLAMLDLDIESLKQLSKENKIVEKYTNTVININEEREFFKWKEPEEEQNSREINDYQSGFEEGIKKGLEWGIEKGTIKEKEDIVKKMLGNSIDIDIISTITDLSREKIENLQ